MHATDWDERYRSVDLVWGAEPNQFVREQCQRLPVGVAVDLACGEGRNALWLARQGWKVTGVDYSSVAVDRARQLTAHEPPMVGLRLDWRVEDITMAPLEPSSVDLALLSYVHLSPEAATALLSSAAGAVRPGGHLLIVGHDLRN
ncbi:MAG: class I SAM-dependent methyltransferase, partial [Nocardioidaceae bacterium]